MSRDPSRARGAPRPGRSEALPNPVTLHAPAPQLDLAFLEGGGELGALIRAHDWSATAVGPPERWPQSLKTATAILLRSPVPVVLLWGPQGIMVYNDAYAVFAGGRHPRLLGSPVLEGWPEVADLNRRVMQIGLSGGTLTYRDQHLVLYRHGRAEDLWLNLDYSPVLDETGLPAGVLAIVVDTTERVIGERRLRTLRELGSRTAPARSVEEVCRLALEAMSSENSADLPCAAIYLLGEASALGLAAGYGPEPQHAYRVDPAPAGELAAQIAALCNGTAVIVEADRLRAANAPDEPRHMALLPIMAGGTVSGALAIGLRSVQTNTVGPAIEGRLSEFLELVAAQVSKSVATAQALELSREHEQRLRDSEARYRSLFEHAAVGIEQLALDGALLEVNDALCRMLGYRREEFLGRSFVELTHPEDRDAEAVLLGRLLAGEVRSYSIEKRYLRSDGTPLWVRVTSSLAVADGRPLHRISVIEDVTARKHSEEALAEADRRKDEFLAMLAHELRNPLAPIGNASAVLSHMLAGDSRAQFAVDMIKRQTTQLTRLVDDLLDVSRVTQGRIQLRRRPVDLASVIAQAVETVGPQLRDKRHRVSITKLYEPLYVNADFARLVQCLGNILANATKYMDAGGEIHVRSRADDSSAVIEVADTGAGISPELLPRIFDLFVQSERTLDRAQGGLGIGLAVVKRLVEMHGGEVTAQSPGLGHGSTFEIRLPRIAPPQDSGREPGGIKVPPRRVLIVDDNEDAANSLAMLLAFEGHETAAVYSGREALERVHAFRPDVALLDIGLPDMDGYGLARRLRAMPETRGIRLVALTGYGQAEDIQRTRDAGFDDHLVKPVDLPALARTLAGFQGAESGERL